MFKSLFKIITSKKVHHTFYFTLIMLIFWQIRTIRSYNSKFIHCKVQKKKIYIVYQ